jgi:hypothetical protein
VAEKRGHFPDYRNIAPRKVSPRELYTICEQQEKRLETELYRKRLDLLLESWLFERPLFETAPLAGYRPFEEHNQQMYPFRFSIAPPAHLRISKREWRYRKLLEHLKKQQDTILRWLLIARWMKQEAVCEPKQFLPDAVFRRVVRRFSKSLRFSPTDFRYGIMIHKWRPYFERLQADLVARKHLQRALEEVAKLGYDGKAIICISRKRSTIQATCEWLAQRKNCDARTLRNIYSRLYGHKDNLSWDSKLF